MSEEHSVQQAGPACCTFVYGDRHGGNSPWSAKGRESISTGSTVPDHMTDQHRGPEANIHLPFRLSLIPFGMRWLGEKRPEAVLAACYGGMPSINAIASCLTEQVVRGNGSGCPGRLRYMVRRGRHGCRSYRLRLADPIRTTARRRSPEHKPTTARNRLQERNRLRGRRLCACRGICPSPSRTHAASPWQAVRIIPARPPGKEIAENK